jgi:TRAP-type mannitol/chloroaromatic compound transport system permease small subunit
MEFSAANGLDALLRTSRAIDRFSEYAARVANWLVLISSLVCAGNATFRYLFSYSSNAWLEIQWYMFGAMVFFGASYTLRVNGHVRVDILYSHMSERTRLWVDALGFAFILFPASLYLMVISFYFFWSSFLISEMSSNAGGLPLWPIKAVLPAGFAMLALQALAELGKRIAALNGRIALDTHYEKPLQ